MGGFSTALTSTTPTADRPEARAVEEAIGHVFADRTLLERALTHASVTGGRQKDVRDLERLEFLGDRVLGLLTAEALWRQFPDLDEGELAPRLNAMVRKETCADAARSWHVGPALRLSAGEDRAGGRRKKAILGDACEALLGALYIDAGLEGARAAFNGFWAARIAALAEAALDSKTALQEWAQKAGHGTPRYTDLERSGPDHAPRFTVEVTIQDRPPVTGTGKNKRDAQMAAASAMLIQEGIWDKP